MSDLPETGYMRLWQIINVPANKDKGTPAKQGIIPVCRQTWLKGIKKGLYPQPVKISSAAVAWRVEDIKRLIEDGPGGFLPNTKGDKE